MNFPVIIFVSCLALASAADFPYPASGVPFPEYGPPQGTKEKLPTEELRNIPIAPKLEQTLKAISPPRFEDIPRLEKVPEAPRLPEAPLETPVLYTPLTKIPDIPRIPILSNIPTFTEIHNLVEVPKAPKLGPSSKPAVFVPELKADFPLLKILAPPTLDSIKLTPVTDFQYSPRLSVPAAPKLGAPLGAPLGIDHFKALITVPEAPKLDAALTSPKLLDDFKPLSNVPAAPKLLDKPRGIVKLLEEHAPLLAVPAAPKLDTGFVAPTVPFVHKDNADDVWPLVNIPAAPILTDKPKEIPRFYDDLTASGGLPAGNPDVWPLGKIPEAPRLEDAPRKVYPTIGELAPLREIPTGPKIEALKYEPKGSLDDVWPLVNIPAAPRLDKEDKPKFYDDLTPSGGLPSGNPDIWPLVKVPEPPRLGDAPREVPRIHEEFGPLVIPTAPKIEAFPITPIVPFVPKAYNDDVWPLTNIPDAPKLADAPRDLPKHLDIILPAGPKIETPYTPKYDCAPKEEYPHIDVPTAPKLDDARPAARILDDFKPLITIPVAPKINDAPRELLSIHVEDYPRLDVPSAPKLEGRPEHRPLDDFKPLISVPSAPKIPEAPRELPRIFTEESHRLDVPSAPKLEGRPEHRPLEDFKPLISVPSAPWIPEAPKELPRIFTEESHRLDVPSAPKLDAPAIVAKILDDVWPIINVPAAPKLDSRPLETPIVLYHEPLRGIPEAPVLSKEINFETRPINREELRPILPAPKLEKPHAFPETIKPLIETDLRDLRVIPNAPKLDAFKPKLIEELVPKENEGPYPAPLYPYPAGEPQKVYGSPTKN